MRYFTTMLALAATIAVAAPETAEAQAGGGGGMMFEQVEATPKGTIGLGLIGAELGFVLPAAVGLDQTWAFVVFPLALGGGGAAAGYFLVDSPNSTTLAVGALAAGMLLVVPTMVLTLSLTAYDPADEYGGGEDEVVVEPEGESAALRPAGATPLGPPPLRGGRVLADAAAAADLRLQVPVVSVSF